MAITKIGTPELFDFSATNTALQLPTGTTLQRPTNASAGQWRFNTDKKYVEYYDGTTPYDASKWFQIDTEADANPDDFPSQNFNVNTYFGNGATQAIDAKFNEAANFNGSSSKIALSNYIVGDWNTGGHTISFWVKFNDFNNDHTIYTETNTQYLRGYANIIFSTTKKLKIQYHQTNGSSGNRTLQEADFSSVVVADTWYNMVIAGNDSSTLMYINGVSETVTKTTGLASSNSNSTFAGKFGEWDSGGDVLDGSLDQVRFYNTTLNQTGVDNLQLETTTTASTLSFPSGETAIATFQFDGDASDVGGTYGGVETDIGYTGLKFKPDFVWMKSRQATATQILIDSVRGAYKQLSSNGSDQQYDISPYGLSSFNSNGFTVADVTNGGYGVNGAPGQTYTGTNAEYVGWAWKVGGAPIATNTANSGAMDANSVSLDGSLESAYTPSGSPTIYPDKMSINTKTAISIVTYTGNNTQNATVPHGLGIEPKLVLIKRIDVANDWWAPLPILGSNKFCELNTNASATTDVQLEYTQTTDVFKFTSSSQSAQYNASGGEYVMYSFGDILGYQRVGSYTGDGNTSGNYIYTTSDGTATGTNGFEPAFLLLKNTDTGGTSWLMYDNKRTPTNPRETALIANSGGGDVTTSNFKINFFSNGFEVTGNGSDINGSGDTFIYLAIAADKDTSVPTQANSFSPLSYSGTGALQNLYTPFAPDLSWIKSISNNTSHELNDSVRGQVSRISTDTTGAASDVANGFLSLDPNGFSLNDAGGGGEVNTSGRTYVGWSWKAGGLPTINNDGTITSIVSANQAAGFSIVKYTGNNTQNATVGHGLGIEPKMVIIKRLDVANAWWIPLPVEGSNKFMEFSTASATTDVQYQYTQTTDVFKFTSANQSAQYNASGGSYIMYSFADIANYQKIGTYTGSNSSSKVVPTGFQPRFLLIKSLTSNGNYWNMFDSARTSAPNGKGRLYANGNFAEDGTLDISFDSTSFEILTSNSDINGGNDYLYLAIG